MKDYEEVHLIYWGKILEEDKFNIILDCVLRYTVYYDYRGESFELPN